MRFGWIFILLNTCFTLWGQNSSEMYQRRFTHHLKSIELDSLQQLVKEWRNDLPNDPEGFVATFNFYLLKSSQEELQDDVQSFSDSKKIYVDSALEVLDTALSFFPKRLDMHMGYIYTLGQNEYWNKYTPRILSLLEKAKLSDYEGWLWSSDRPIGKETKSFIIESILDYQYTLYNAYSDSLLLDLRKIALAILSVHPHNVDQLNLMALSYSEMKDYNQAYKWIRKAIEVAPTEVEVQQNFKNILLKTFKVKDAKKEIRRLLLQASEPLCGFLTVLYTSI